MRVHSADYARSHGLGKRTVGLETVHDRVRGDNSSTCDLTPDKVM